MAGRLTIAQKEEVTDVVWGCVKTVIGRFMLFLLGVGFILMGVVNMNFIQGLVVVPVTVSIGVSGLLFFLLGMFVCLTGIMGNEWWILE